MGICVSHFLGNDADELENPPCFKNQEEPVVVVHAGRMSEEAGGL